MRNLAVVLEFDRPGVVEDDLVVRVLERLLDAFPEGDPLRPHNFQLALSNAPYSALERRVNEWAVEPERGDPDMGIVKHGDGRVIPETEQQKTAARQGSQMSEQDRLDLARENAEADADTSN